MIVLSGWLHQSDVGNYRWCDGIRQSNECGCSGSIIAVTNYGKLVRA